MTRDDDARLDALLQGLPPGPSVSFTDDVMRRVRTAHRAAPVTAAPFPPSLPWWTRALLQPSTLGALAVAGLFAGWWPEILEGATRASSSLGAGLASGHADPPVWSGLAVASIIGSLLLAYLAVQGAQAFLAAPRGRPQTADRPSSP
jgi:hypothetical protein